MQNSPVTCPELFAASQGACCSGPDRCHWCGAPCERWWRHDDAPPAIGVRNYLALCPGNAYICHGCWLFRRRRVTVQHLDGSYSDGQTPSRCSWWITPDGAWSLRVRGGADRDAAYALLLKPPLTFSLALLEDPAEVCHLQRTPVNDFSVIHADTPLRFSLDNRTLAYTAYELTEALKGGLDGREPGVRALVRLLGPPEARKAEEDAEKRGRGRPPKRDDQQGAGNPARRVVTSDDDPAAPGGEGFGKK